MATERARRQASDKANPGPPTGRSVSPLSPLTTQISVSGSGLVCRVRRTRDAKSGSVIATLDRARG